MNIFNNIKNKALNMLKLNVKVKRPSIKGFSENPIKYLFYAMTILLPIITFFLLNELKIFTIILISYMTFLKYLNLCMFQKLCILKNNEKECKLNETDLKEALSLGLGSFILLWLLKTIYKVFSGK